MDEHAAVTLAQTHLGIVERVLNRLTQRGLLPDDDLRSAGYLGLVQAAHRYKPGQADFFVYAWRRVQGAMQDELRSQVGDGRGYARFARVVDELQQQVGRELDDHELHEVGQRSGVSHEPVQLFINRRRGWGSLALDADDAGEHLDAANHADPARLCASLQLFELLETAPGLTTQERLVLRGVYASGFSMAELAKQLNLTQSRISQVHTKALSKLRRWFVRAKHERR